MEDTAAVALDMLGVLAAGGLGLVAGLAVSVLLSVLMRLLVRRRPSLGSASRRAKLPQRVFLAVFGAGIGVAIATSAQVAGTEPPWRASVLHVHLIIVILLAAWLLSALVFALADSVLARYQGLEQTNHSRRVRTQTQLLRRLGIAVIWLVAIAGALSTIDAFRGFGASLFASAGLVSIVAGLAAQSTLGNVFAGLQIAFTDSVRVGDVVVANGSQATVEEMTLTYVVVHLWDGRRMILPSSYFTTTPFENWTRRSESNLLGTVEWDLDWLAPVPAMRIELHRIVEASDLWDGRTVGLQVVESTGGPMRVRAVVSAANSGRLWDLRCHVREEMVAWLQRHAIYALPRTRMEPETTTAPPMDERQEFIDEVQRRWEHERAGAEGPQEAHDLTVVPFPESETRRIAREAEARRARREAERADRRAARQHPAVLGGHDAVLPSPSGDATQVMDEAPSSTEPARASILAKAAARRSADARLYSGSPDADERARLMEGPPPEEMAEREQSARRRSQETSAPEPMTQTLTRTEEP